MLSRNNIMASSGKKILDSDLFSRITQAAWLDGSADYLSKSYSSGGDRTEWIVSAWIRPIKFSNCELFSAGDGSDNNRGGIQFNSGGSGTDFNVKFLQKTSGSNDFSFTVNSDAFYRDIQWWHVLFSYDSDNGTSSDRMKVYINGIEATLSFSTGISSGQQTYIGSNSHTHYVGRSGGSTARLFKGVIAQLTYLDGVSIQQGDYAITNFLELKSYGTNGSQYVPKSDNDLKALANSTGGNSVCLTENIGDGTDASTASNNFTPVSMSHSANGTTDTPSNPHFLWNTLHVNADQTTWLEIANGGTTYKTVGVAGVKMITHASIFPNTGKWCWRLTIDTATGGEKAVGIVPIKELNTSGFTYGNNSVWRGVGFSNGGAGYYLKGDGSSTSVGNDFALADSHTVTVYWDADSRKLWLKHNSTVLNDTGGTAGDPSAGTNPMFDLSAEDDYAPGIAFAFSDFGTTNTFSLTADSTFSDGDFKALTYANIPITNSTTQGTDVFKILHHTGNQVAKSVTGAGFQPGFFFTVNLDFNLNRAWGDYISGANIVIQLNSSSPKADDTADGTNGSFTAFESDGVTLGSGTSMTNNFVNRTGDRYSMYVGHIDGTGAANSAGNINSTTYSSANGHMHIVDYVGNGTSAQTVGHDMGAVPDALLVMNLDDYSGGAHSKAIWHFGLDYYHANPCNYFHLSHSDGAYGFTSVFNTTKPTSTVFSVGDWGGVNASGLNYRAVLLKNTPGVFHAACYEPNQNTDGPYIPLGFRPQLVVIKVTGAAGSWMVYDTKRHPTNPIQDVWHFDSGTEASSSSYAIDVLSDGIKIRNSHVTCNQNGAYYAVMAWADIAGGGELAPVYGR